MNRVGWWNRTCCGKDTWQLLTFEHELTAAQKIVIYLNMEGELAFDEDGVNSDEWKLIYKNPENPVTSRIITQEQYNECVYRLRYLVC